MPYSISPVDGARLFYTDYRPSASGAQGSACPAYTPPGITHHTSALPENFTLVFIHGWPMSSEMYTHLMLPISQNHRLRCIAPDRRGFGRSEWTGPSDAGEITYETFAHDTISILEQADIKREWIWVASSMGCGESVLADEMLRRSQDPKLNDLGARCRGFVWLGASLPYPLKSELNPTAPGREVWDAILAGLRADRVGFVKVAIDGVFGSRKEMGLDIELSATKIEYFEHIIRQADALAIERCPMIITGKDFSGDLQKMMTKVLVLHGDGDQGMPASASAALIENLMPKGLCEVKIYEKAAHGLYLTHAEMVLEDLLKFIVSVSS